MYKIGFDAKRAFSNFTGLGNYSRTIISSLSGFYSSNKYFLYTPRYKQQPVHNFTDKPNIEIITPHGFSSIFSRTWRTTGIINDLKRDKIDIYHGLSGELPEGKKVCPMVVTVHDAIFMKFSGFYTYADRFFFEKKRISACRRADKIIAISNQTADDIIKYFNADPKKIEVIYQSCDPVFHRSITDEELYRVRKKYNLPCRYILSVGRVETRKNLNTLVRTLPQLPPDVKIVSLGGITPYFKEVLTTIKTLGLSERVQILSGADFADFPAIYKMSAMLVYASLYEGFGIPVLEALTTGTPVVTSNISSMPEVGGDAALYVNPENVNDIAEKINMFLSSPTLCEEMTGKGLEFSKRFREEKVVSEVYDLYNTILK